MIARWLRSWSRMRLESSIIGLDRAIESIREMRAEEIEHERDMTEYRAQLARKLQAMAREEIDLATQSNVRSIK